MNAFCKKTEYSIDRKKIFYSMYGIEIEYLHQIDCVWSFLSQLQWLYPKFDAY